MTSQKQIESNRRNAQKSTGPKTAEGKERSSRNAIKHGLYSTAIVVDSPHVQEDPKEYNHLLASLLWELKPEGVLQHSLVHKIANSLWRYKRMIRAETGCLQDRFEKVSRFDFTRLLDHPDLETEKGRQAYAKELEHRREVFVNRSHLPRDSDALTLLRYEMRLDRQLARSYRLLRELQEQRAAEERAYAREKARNAKTKK